MIAIFSLKNPSFPERIISVDSAVLSMDFHKEMNSILAVGYESGSVGVFDIKLAGNHPIFTPSPKTKKHTDPVYQIKWSQEKSKMNFYSISSDGRVLNWFAMKNLLECEEVYKLKLVPKK